MLDSSEARQISGQQLDASFVCSSDANVQSAKVRIELDATSHLPENYRKAPQHLLCGCAPLANYSCARARCSVAPQGIEWFLTCVPLCVADGPREQQHSTQVWWNRVLGRRRSITKHNSYISTKVKPQVGTARCKAVGQHGCLPERGVSDGRRPVLPAVSPLAAIPCFAWVRPFALPEFVPAWSPPESFFDQAPWQFRAIRPNNLLLVV